MPTEMAAAPTSDHQRGAAPRYRESRLLRSPFAWLALAILATLVHACLRIWITPWFYFWDDTQLGAYGQWYELGRRLLNGSWTILDPGAWQGGNLLAEGQWGLWSPLAWGVALASHLFPSAAVFATIVKISFLVLLCVGVFLLARDYGATPGWAAVASFSATAGGQTVYLDSPSWVTGLQAVSLFVLCWYALRRYVARRSGPVLFLAASYLLITTGYVFGVIELAVLFLFVLIEATQCRQGGTLWRTLLPGIYAGLLTVVVYLPGILTSPVTVRSGQGIDNDLFLNMDLSDLATSSTSTAVTTVRGYWGDVAPVPLQYVTWLLPLLVIVGVGLFKLRREFISLYGVLFLTLALVLGPSVLGPLRYPARMMPYVVVCAAVLIAVLCSRSWPPRIAGSRLGWMGIAACLGACFAWAAVPSTFVSVFLALALQLVGLASLVVIAVRVKDGRREWMLPAVALLFSVLVLVPQAVKYPTSALGNFNVPSDVQAMQAVGQTLPDGVMTVGDVYSLRDNPDAYSESLIANLWYLSGRDVVGVYTVLPFREFASDLCLDIRGATCPETLDALFETDALSPVPVADDLGLNAVIVIPGPGLESPPKAPAGWTLESREDTWLLTRGDHMPAAGGVARASDGVEVSQIAVSDLEVAFRVDEVPDGAGSVVMSRLAWPGYSVAGAHLAKPERGYLLTVDVSGVAPGTVVTVTFRPPGWEVELASFFGALFLGVILTIASFIERRRRSRAVGFGRDAGTPHRASSSYSEERYRSWTY